MFESLGDRFESIFRKIRGADRLTEENMKDALREVRLALLEADVNYKVVKDFVGQVSEKAVGQQVVKGVDPAQQLIKIVHDELVAMMKGFGTDNEDRPFIVQPGKLNIIMMLGLQGAGKTTFCGKLASHLAKERCKPLLVACDVYRPAAIEQLKTVGGAMGFPVYSAGTETPVVEIVRGAIEQAKKTGRDVLILDTAGRLHIDEVKMDELIAVRDQHHPDYTFLVADAMTGQDAVNSAKAFNEQVGIDGVCLTKMDGDARGGAALSIKAVTGKPIVFIGTGEKSENLERFHPDRVATRILGMGDVVSLVEKAQAHIDERDAMDMQAKLVSGQFSYDDFLKQMRMIRGMGSIKGLLSMLPGVGQALKGIDSDVMEKELKKFEAIIQSMSKAERANGDLISKSAKRRERIAKGSGHDLKTVTQLVQQFDQMKGMMAQMGAMGGFPGMPGMPAPGGGGMLSRMKGMMRSPFGGMMGGGMPPMPPGGMPGMGMPGMGMPGMPMSKKMLREQKAMIKHQEREIAAQQPRKKKDRKKKSR